MTSRQPLASRSAGARHGIWSLAEALVWPAGLLLLAPLIAHFRHIEAYGTLLFLTAIIGVAPMLMPGTQFVLIKHISADTEPDRPGDELVGAAIILAGSVITVLLLAFVTFHLTRNHWNLVHTLQAPFLLACSAGAIGLVLDQVSVGILKGLSKFKLSAQLEAITRSAQIIATAVAAMLTASDDAPAIALGWATLAGSTTRFVIATRHIRWRFPERWLGKPIQLVRSGWWLLLGSVGGYCFMSFDRVIVGSLLGPRALAIYGISVQMAQFSHMLLAAYFQPMMTAVSRLQAEVNFTALSAKVRSAHWKALTAVTATSIGAALIGPVFVAHGLKTIPAVDDLRVLWLCIAAGAAMGMGVPAYYTLLGLGRFSAVSLVSLAGGLLLVGALASIGSTGGLLVCAAARAIAALATLAGSALVLWRQMRSSAVAFAVTVPLAGKTA